MTPAKAVDPGQEPSRGNGVTLLINNARQYLVMQDFVRLAAIDHRLINQLKLLICQRMLQANKPQMLIFCTRRNFSGGNHLMVGVCFRFNQQAIGLDQQ